IEFVFKNKAKEL
nr:Chain C, Synthetic peptide [Homo sapiens]